MHEGDIRSFRSNTKYPLVIIPYASLQHMCTVTDQVAALETAAFHLAPEGALAFDVPHPRLTSIRLGIGEEVLKHEWTPKSDPGKIMRRYARRESADKIDQTFSLTYIYRTYEGGKLISGGDGAMSGVVLHLSASPCPVYAGGIGSCRGVWII